MNEKSRKNQGGLLAKLILAQLLIALVYQTRYQMNAMRQGFYSMVKNADYLIYIIMNINGNIRC